MQHSETVTRFVMATQYKLKRDIEKGDDASYIGNLSLQTQVLRRG